MNKELKVIVAGGRDFLDMGKLTHTMNALLVNYEPQNVTVVSGTARGADTLAIVYSEKYETKLIKMPADWDRHGRGAGFIRNVEMAEMADALVAFWDGKSKGTKHMIDTAKKKNLSVRVINYR